MSDLFIKYLDTVNIWIKDSWFNVQKNEIPTKYQCNILFFIIQAQHNMLISIKTVNTQQVK